MRVTLDHRGEELAAEQGEDGTWSVTLGGRTVRARYLDYALAELLRMRPGEVIPLARPLIQQLPNEPEEKRAE